jgi:hypothetical protein
MFWKYLAGFVVVALFLGMTKPFLPEDTQSILAVLSFVVMWLVVRKRPIPSGRPSRVPVVFAGLTLFMALDWVARSFPDADVACAIGQGVVALWVLAYACSLTVRSWFDSRVLKL